MFRKQVFVLVLILSLSAATFFNVTPVQAATITVTSKLDTADQGKCRLRDAIAAANFNTAIGDCPAGTAGMDTISFSLGLQCNLTPCTITLTGALPTVTENLTINGNGTTTPGGGGFTCAGTDQRGVARPQAVACDIGAVERQLSEVNPVIYLPAVLK